MENFLTQELELNKNANGGGLATNITGRFESNRHAIARIEKITFGEAVAFLKQKRNGGLNISASELLEIYIELFGTPEWHHAGKLPKSYGGGMKKTYFLDEQPTAEQVQEWQRLYAERQAIKKQEQEEAKKREEQKKAFCKKYGTWFSRVKEVPKYGVVEFTEMNGKFGWFVVESRHSYNLTEYYSGWAFKSKKSLEKYMNL